MADCLFCSIVAGKVPSQKVYEDDRLLVLLDRYPVNPGHLLITTKAHIASFYDVEDGLYTALMLLVKRAALALNEAIRPLQVVMQTSGIGNRHVHVHVIPVQSMYDLIPKERLDALESEERRASDDALASMARRLRPLLRGRERSNEEPA